MNDLEMESLLLSKAIILMSHHFTVINKQQLPDMTLRLGRVRV